MESDREETEANELTSVDVELKFGGQSKYEVELVCGIKEPHLILNSGSEIIIAGIVNHLKNLGYPLDHSMVWYFSPTANVNVFCGNDPLPASISVPSFEVADNTLYITCRESVKNEFGTIITLGSFPSIMNKQEEEAITTHKASRRTKERKIGYIIEKVSKWRKLYNGIQNTIGDLEKFTLEEASSKVGISKKSLDDYLLQLRFGKRFGFNFQEHKDDKVGVLRAFVKKFKALQNYEDKVMRGEEVPDEIARKLQEPGTPACKHNRCCAPQFALPFKLSESS